jgi:ectoine hydroxylase-related dioxygenase (phytanoyl-CoA dioxygenase family)
MTSAQLQQAQQKVDQLLESDLHGVLQSQGVGYGVRNLLEHWPEAAALVSQSAEVLDLVRDTLGFGAGVVRGLVFDKPPERSWTLPWHRDRTIAVQHTDSHPPGFRSPTTKAGVLHLNAPNEFLARMLTLRFSIDPMTRENGQLNVMPGSHKVQSAEDSDLETNMPNVADDEQPPPSAKVVPVECSAGDVFVMRPLLAHCSAKSWPETRLRRRVIHLELAPPEALPGGLKWQNFLPINPADSEN